jgi:hypothetical protein
VQRAKTRKGPHGLEETLLLAAPADSRPFRMHRTRSGAIIAGWERDCEQEGEPPMRSQSDITGSEGSRNAWSSIVVRDHLLLTARASSVVGGVRCE